mmetsp:Transcript_108342/g.345500  ORF Transcript_108342/g.345500 Transcript_108342/m.345500 type:complete len:96 (-) Transcript_108342:49-336(-)
MATHGWCPCSASMTAPTTQSGAHCSPSCRWRPASDGCLPHRCEAHQGHATDGVPRKASEDRMRALFVEELEVGDERLAKKRPIGSGAVTQSNAVW